MRFFQFAVRAVSRILFVMALGVVSVVRCSNSMLPKHLLIGEDGRLVRLRLFFSKHGLPAAAWASDFLRAADTHGLDWRLLPSLAMVESTGGKFATNNNMFGCGEDIKTFSHPREGIYHVAERLARSPLYRHKKLRSRLLTYNPCSAYAERVERVMRMLELTTMQTPAPTRSASVI